MSAFGTKRTSESTQLMSAFGGKADMAPARLCGEKIGERAPLPAVFFNGPKRVLDPRQGLLMDCSSD
jgi:hypothetical protein